MKIIISSSDRNYKFGEMGMTMDTNTRYAAIETLFTQANDENII